VLTSFCVHSQRAVEIEEELPQKAELTEADEIIAGGLGRASTPKALGGRIWAEFDAVRARIAANDMSEALAG